MATSDAWATARDRMRARVIPGILVGAIVLVHLPAGFFAPNGIEFPLALLGAYLGYVTWATGSLYAAMLVAPPILLHELAHKLVATAYHAVRG